MAVAAGTDSHTANGDRSLLFQADEAEVRGHEGERHREVQEALLVGEGQFQIVVAVDDDAVARDVGGGKEWEALDVVPMGVAEEKMDSPLTSAARALHELQPQPAEPGAAIDDDRLAGGLDLDAGGVAPHRTAYEAAAARRRRRARSPGWRCLHRPCHGWPGRSSPRYPWNRAASAGCRVRPRF